MQPDNSIIEIDGKQYDLRQLSPSALESLQLAQAAQVKVNEANTAVKLANLALQGAMGNLRANMATQPTYAPPPPPEPEPGAPEPAPKKRPPRK